MVPLYPRASSALAVGIPGGEKKTALGRRYTRGRKVVTHAKDPLIRPKREVGALFFCPGFFFWTRAATGVRADRHVAWRSGDSMGAPFLVF